MIRLIIVGIFVLTSLAFGTSTEPTQPEVYICKGKSSKKYHLTNSCRGLSRCSTSIYKVTIAEAKKMNRTLCGWED